VRLAGGWAIAGLKGPGGESAKGHSQNQESHQARQGSISE
jgi:hypothetical protein